MGLNCLKATVTSRRQFTFYRSVSRNSWYSFYRPWKDERLSQPSGFEHGTLNWESGALATRVDGIKLLKNVLNSMSPQKT